MEQVKTVSLPVSARRHLVFTRLARSAGFVTAVGLGLAVAKIPVERIITGVSVMLAIEAVSAGVDALNDDLVQEAMDHDHFGTQQQTLEAAGVGLGVGFAAIAACMTLVKFMKKGEQDEQSG